ncbi:MAG: hypothetical protein ACXITV_08410 [Luteibaculaceae bacterium]
MANKSNVIAFVPNYMGFDFFKAKFGAKDKKEALFFYHKLLESTASKFVSLNLELAVFLSDYPEEYAAFSDLRFKKFLKVSDFILENYAEAFEVSKQHFNGAVVIVNPVVDDLEQAEVLSAFDRLIQFDLIISTVNEENPDIRFLALDKSFEAFLGSLSVYNTMGLYAWIESIKEKGIRVLEL